MLKYLWYYLTLIIFIAYIPVNNSYAQSSAPFVPWQNEYTHYKTNDETNNLDQNNTTYVNLDQNNTTKASPPLSSLEKMYANRIIDEPKQFGYDIFDNLENKNFTPMGAVQDDFVLGAGDSLQITFTGQRTDQQTYKINAEGTLNIKEFPPITAMGMTISQLRKTVSAYLAEQHNTKAYISLSSIRQINVLVVGHVKSPGRKNLNVFSEVLDALSLAGGITKDGSLRRIKLIRNGRSRIIDLYDLLINGAPYTNMRLKDGDRIIIPPIGPSVAISGAVKRAGIYEIRASRYKSNNLTHLNGEKLSLNDMLKLAGGILSTGKNRFLKLSTNSEGEETITQITNPNAKLFSDGAILSVLKDNEKRKGTIEIIGHTNSSGLHDLSKSRTLADLLKNDNILGKDIYPLIGVIKRWDKSQLTNSYISYPLRLVLQNKFNLTMQDNDKVILLSNEDISKVFNNETEYNKTHNNDREKLQKTNDIFTNNPELKNYLKERSVYLRGAVRKAGSYPIAQGITLDNLLAVAGGLTLQANKENIEITSRKSSAIDNNHRRSGTHRTIIDLSKTNPEDIELFAGDAVRVNQKFRKMDEKTVLILGEVAHPGTYDLLAGDKVLDLITRAGGITKQGYPAGAIFSRESERISEQKRFRAAAIDMQRRLAAAIQRDKNPPDAAQIEMVRALSEELSTVEALGRITVETNPDILSVRPELNMLLEDHDRIYIPKRPLTVRVSGEVLSPASLQFKKEKKPIDYIHEAGGFTYNADKNRAFVLYPNGSAEPLKVNVWNHNPIFIPPGSTIIVPRDPKPFDFIESAKEIGQILSNLAITAVFIDNIRE